MIVYISAVSTLTHLQHAIKGSYNDMYYAIAVVYLGNKRSWNWYIYIVHIYYTSTHVLSKQLADVMNRGTIGIYTAVKIYEMLQERLLCLYLLKLGHYL